jgi:membrane-associated phospholipid phosphatase
MYQMATTHSANAWKTYAFWAMWVGVAFFSVYPTCNWLTSLRGEYFSLYFPGELNVPFVPEFIVVYLSMYVLLAMPPIFLQVAELTALGKQLIAGTLFSGLIFMILPARLGFVRQVPEGEFFGPLYSTMFTVDMPHNMVPSLHVVFSALILLALAGATTDERYRLLWYGWLIVICASTLLVHQHHLIDVVAGLALAFLLRQKIVKREQDE